MNGNQQVKLRALYTADAMLRAAIKSIETALGSDEAIKLAPTLDTVSRAIRDVWQEQS